MEYPFLSSSMGSAVTATLLLSDYDKYNLSERVCYHFDLTEALAVSEQVRSADNNETAADPIDYSPIVQAEHTVCGVASLLECVPSTPWHRLTRKQKRALKNVIKNFNIQANAVRQDPTVYCHQPRWLPLRLTPSTRVYFAYEMTRIVFCLDASPTLTSTFGFSSGGGADTACCPMDRLADMVHTFFASLMEPEQVPSTTNKGVWRPSLAVTVLAVFPRGTGSSQRTSLLVRDFRVTDTQSAELLSDKIQEWALSEVETEISKRLSGGNGMMGDVPPGASYDAWTMPMYSSSLCDLLDAGDAALSTLSSAARPCIVVATDGRSVACDGIIDVLSDQERVDIPLFVLDLSSPSSHDMAPAGPPEKNGDSYFQLMDYDPVGAAFPLHLSDDTEALYAVCKATGGCFFDRDLLLEASTTKAGDVGPGSPLLGDQFFAFKSHTFRPNAVQWYTFFSLSPLSETPHSSWGNLAPPEYIRRRLGLTGKNELATTASNHRPSFVTLRSKQSSGSIDTTRSQGTIEGGPLLRKAQVRSTFSTYTMNPVRIKVLLLMRAREGYRAKQYGQSTNDPDKVFIHFTLQLELGTILHYELSYKALHDQYNHMVGSAHIKIQLSGEASFVQAVKDDFLHPSRHGRPLTMAQQISARLCSLVRWIRKEDAQQSYLTPLKWSDQLNTQETPFVKRLSMLTGRQRKHHYRSSEFDCVCLHRIPYAHDDDFLREFRDDGDGEREMFDAVTEWSTQTLDERRRYVRRMQASDGGVATYCVLELVRSPMASRVFTVSIDVFGGTDATDRLVLISSVRSLLGRLKDVEVLSKQMGQFLVRTHQSQYPVSVKQRLLESHHNHTTWDLINDRELLPLLMKRRSEIGNFLVLDSSDDRALFAKLVRDQTGLSDMSDPGDLVQYQLAILPDRVVVDLHMESEGGEFYPFRSIKDDVVRQSTSKFHKMGKLLKKRDQECGRALRCRTSLLRAFTEDTSVDETQDEGQVFCVEKLLPYASSSCLRLRFFHTGSGSGSANSVLRSLTAELLLSESTGVKVAKLSIDAEVGVSDLGPGDWFLVEFDRQTISFIHLAWNEKEDASGAGDVGFAYRELTFLTIGISDLYSRRDDIADDDSSNDHISEYLRVSELSDLVEAAHKDNYCSAAYIALKSESPLALNLFHSDDFAEVMRPLEFVEVVKVLVAGTTDSESGESKLLRLIETILQPIENDKYCLYYRGTTDNERFLSLDDHSDSVDIFSGDSRELSIDPEDDEEDTILSLISEPSLTRTEGGDDNSLPAISLDTALPSGRIASAPIFVRFWLDGAPATLEDLARVNKSSSLSALVSIFSDADGVNGTLEPRKMDPSELPLSHLNAAIELSISLNAYVAEQTLERLRHYGLKIEEDDLGLAKACLRKARGVITSTTEVFFFVGKKDSMVPAAAHAGADAQVEEGFKLVFDELRKHSGENLMPYGENGFLFAETQSVDAPMPYWCFVNIRKMRGDIAVEVHHPSGSDTAVEVLSTVHELITTCCHRVNQMLLLRHLHGSRTASALLIAPEPDNTHEQVQQLREENVGPFHAGLFGCPIVFKTSFDLFHRCAASPFNVARTLEMTVLQIFGVSNRRHVFVYKDETGSIFYMSLLVEGGGIEADGTIELLVHGVYEPGPSVTTQLKRLLQKRLLMIAVDMWSTVLTKNPYYHWQDADFAFVRSYEAELQSLEEEKPVTSVERERFYEFPPAVYDPGMVLLYFRQNLCGSTFFHRLQGWDPSIEDDLVLQEDSPVERDTNLVVNWSSFAFYYNNAPSKLDPKLQKESTLTAKGRQFSRSAGTGIALVEVSLVDGDGKEVQEINFAIPPTGQVSNLDIPLEDYRFREDKDPHRPTAPHVRRRVRIKITDTALKRDVIHEWILLTLNQVLTAWTIERHLERNQRGLLRARELSHSCLTFATDQRRREVIEQVSPGLPALISLLQSSYDLPHPATLKMEHEGTVRSSAVATVALELLENTLLSQLRAETKGKLSLDVASDLCVVRLSRSERPRRVHLSWDSSQNEKAVVRAISDSGERAEVIRDAPIDCPEYLCFYSFSEYSNTSGDGTVSPPRLFEHVIVDDRTSDQNNLLSSLEKLKEQYPSSFSRSFAFIFSIKRNRRKLLTYNWSPQLFKSTVSRLSERDSAFLASTGRSVNQLQHHSLKILSPKFDGFEARPTSVGQGATPRSLSKSESSAAAPEPSESGSVADQGGTEQGLRPAPTRRIARPLIMRRPKLIGKSVDGAAMHAVAASRARATTPAYGSGAATPKGQGAEPKSSSSRNSSTGRSNEKTRQRPTQARESRVETSQDDKEYDRVQKEFSSLSETESTSLLRQHTAQVKATRSLITLYWPVKQKQTVQLRVADFLLSQSSRAWSDSSMVLQLPASVLNSFPLSFGQALSAWTPGLRLLALGTTSSHPAVSSRNAPVLLMGAIRNVRSCKCFGVVKLSTTTRRVAGKTKTIVACDGFVLTLPRRSKKSGSNRQICPSPSRSMLEKDATGMVKLGSDLRESLPLESMLFDFTAWVVERALKSVDGKLDYNEALGVVREMISTHQLCRQIRVLRSNYKAFEATIVLKSYRSRLIDMHQGPILFQWLVSNAANRSLIPSGPDGLCFKREVIVQGTQSIVFLTCDPTEKGKMKLVLLCRTQGRNLYDFMFRDRSNVAISIVDNIAVEAAGLAFEEFLAAAASLHRDALWGRVSRSSSQRSSLDKPISEDLDELLELTTVTPIGQYVRNKADSQRLALILDGELGVDWPRFCSVMSKDASFSPSWALSDDDEQKSRRLFFMHAEDLFVLSKLAPNGKTLQFFLVERDRRSCTGTRSASSIQKLANFALHFFWSECE